MAHFPDTSLPHGFMQCEQQNYSSLLLNKITQACCSNEHLPVMRVIISVHPAASLDSLIVVRFSDSWGLSMHGAHTQGRNLNDSSTG
jgi:hypothetical protein